MTTLRLYPPIWFLLFSIIAFLVHWLWPLSFDLPIPLKMISIAIMVSGVVLAAWARATFRSYDTSANPFAEADCLVTTGPYRYSRNPMYMGMLLVLIGLGFWLQSLTALMVMPLFVYVINHCHIVPEEQRLMKRFGKSFNDYCATTRRWF